MPRVAGVDLGTTSIDICGLDDGRVFLERTMATADAMADSAALLDVLEAAAPLDLIAGPSGYGLPLTLASELSAEAIQLASLAVEGEPGGIGGFRTLLRALAASPLPIVLTPGVIHLPTVPAHRKVNRVDMGTADKVCAVALAIHEESRRRECPADDVSCLFLELGGAFSAVIAVERGRIVDGAGGTAGPMGLGAAGALDGEVAFLAGHVSKPMLFGGGAQSVGLAHETEHHPDAGEPRARLAWQALVESIAKAIAAMSVSVPGVRDIIVSGRLASNRALQRDLEARLTKAMGHVTLHTLGGFARRVKQGAQGAALLADGLAGGASASLVTTLGIREARGSVLDHLHVISADAARRRLGLAP